LKVFGKEETCVTPHSPTSASEEGSTEATEWEITTSYQVTTRVGQAGASAGELGAAARLVICLKGAIKMPQQCEKVEAMKVEIFKHTHLSLHLPTWQVLPSAESVPKHGCYAQMAQL